jgi:hypothetical protein
LYWLSSSETEILVGRYIIKKGYVNYYYKWSFPHAQYHQMARESPSQRKKQEPSAGNTHPQ